MWLELKLPEWILPEMVEAQEGWFAYPEMLWGLWFLPLLLLWFGLGHWSRRADRFADPIAQRRLLPRQAQITPWLRGFFLLLGFACLIIAAARPRYGKVEEEIITQGIDLLIILDTSRSMLARDVTPNRFTRAKADISDLLRKLPNDRVGLLAYAGVATLQVPLTTDYEFIREYLERLEVTTVPVGGSRLGDALRKAANYLPNRFGADRVVLLISDGDDQESHATQAASTLADAGIQVIAIGLGDPVRGTKIPLPEPVGNQQYVMDRGEPVISKLNESLLQQIAEITKGVYIPAQTRVYDLGEIYEKHLAERVRNQGPKKTYRIYREWFQLFIGIGLGCFFLVAFWPTWSQRPPLPFTINKQPIIPF